MRAAEAVRLGSLVLKPLRGGGNFGNNNFGCALEMANKATGKRGIEVYNTFPWLEITETELPCNCVGPAYMLWLGNFQNERPHKSKEVLVHLFNQHVCDGDWTIDRLCEWLDSVDPTPRETEVPCSLSEQKEVSAVE